MKQPILDELHCVREKMLEESGGTLAGLVARLQSDQAKSKREVRKSRITMRCTDAAVVHDSENGETHSAAR